MSTGTSDRILYKPMKGLPQELPRASRDTTTQTIHMHITARKDARLRKFPPGTGQSTARTRPRTNRNGRRNTCDGNTRGNGYHGEQSRKQWIRETASPTKTAAEIQREHLWWNYDMKQKQRPGVAQNANTTLQHRKHGAQQRAQKITPRP